MRNKQAQTTNRGRRGTALPAMRKIIKPVDLHDGLVEREYQNAMMARKYP